MIDGGFVIIFASLALMLLPHRQGGHVARRPASTIIASAPLRTTYQPTMPPVQLAELVARADAALEQDDLTSGLRGINAVYRRP